MKTKYIKIKELGIEITPEQQFNGLTYKEILKKVKESEIATYEILQKIRNLGKYEFTKDFWVFVPNPDKISKDNGYVARFVANSSRAILDCEWGPEIAVASLGVFLYRKCKK